LFRLTRIGTLNASIGGINDGTLHMEYYNKTGNWNIGDLQVSYCKAASLYSSISASVGEIGG
jgi:hypothetical protein